MKTRACLIPLLFLIAGGKAMGNEEKLGRLFFSPEQRTALDRLPSDAADTPEGSVTVDGEIWRNSERRARWVNGQSSADMPAEPPAIPVGDRYRLAGKRRESLLGDGQLIVKPGSPAK